VAGESKELSRLAAELTALVNEFRYEDLTQL
jgi:hypothetical protein